MIPSKTTPRRDAPRPRGRPTALAGLALLGGCTGLLAGRRLADALQALPAWAGPAIAIGSVALLVVGLLLLPAALRSGRRTPRTPG